MNTNYFLHISSFEGVARAEDELYGSENGHFGEDFPFFIPVVFMVVFVGGIYWWKRKK